MTDKKIWKIRTKKLYAEETNHVVVGELIEMNAFYVKMRCRTFHFKRPTQSSGIIVGEIKTRLFPWDTISYIAELPENLQWETAKAEFSQKGDIVLKPQTGSDEISLKEALDA
jgi:hypothetical protein